MKDTILALLLVAVAGCESRNPMGISGIDIWKAVEEENIEMIRLYVANGGDIETGRRLKGKTPLFHAMDLEKRESFEELLRLGASANTICHRGTEITCPLHWSAMIEDPYWLKRMLEHDGDPNLKLVRGRRVDLPLSFAISSRETLESVRLLIEYGANANADVRTSPNISAVSYAASSGNSDRWKKVLLLLEHGADYEKGGYSPRVMASLMQRMAEKVQLKSIVTQEPGFSDVVQWLKVRGADPERARWNGTKWVYDLEP